MLFAQLFPTVQASAEEEQQDERYDAIMERGELVVGLSADYAPYEFHATVDGEDEIVGFDVSIAQKIADDMGVDLHIEELGFDALLGALDTGKIDLIISGMSPTPERLQEVDFSDPYMNSQQRLVVREEDQDEYTDVNQFEGVPIGVQKQTTQEELANTELEGSQVTSLQKIPDVVMNLKNGKVDGAVLEGPVAKAYVDENDDLAFSNVEFEDGAKQSAVALPKDSPILSENINRSIQTINDENLLEGYQEEANNLMFDEDQSFFEEYYPYYLSGTGYTILLAIVGVIFGIILGTIFALMKLSSIKILRALASIYIEYVRGTPLLVQIFIVYFGTGILGLDLSRFVAGCIALSLNSAAYVAEIIRAGINGVNKGQMEAARSLGMDRTKAMRYIIFPQAIKNILPALGNEFVTVIKESSVISVIGVSELIFQAGNVQGASFKPFLPYLIVSLIYFVLTFTLSRLLGVAERRMKTSD
ncbi:ABC transporter permease [Tetragenococcus koreensis]|nr:ABC transporter permease [Tetragenococcus koreensis]